MKVQIEGMLYLESDECGFQIKEYTGKVSEKGVEQCFIRGYFSSLEICIQHLIRMKIKETTATTLTELAQDVRRIDTYIRQQLAV